MLQRPIQLTLILLTFGLLPSAAIRAADTQLMLGEHLFLVELAVSAEERAKGLQHRHHLPKNGGMLFVYDQAYLASFWMKNTYIPLDILFFNEDAELTHYYDSVRPCRATPCPRYSSKHPIHYVLELNAGTRQRLNIKLGQSFEINLNNR